MRPVIRKQLLSLMSRQVVQLLGSLAEGLARLVPDIVAADDREGSLRGEPKGEEQGELARNS